MIDEAFQLIYNRLFLDDRSARRICVSGMSMPQCLRDPGQRCSEDFDYDVLKQAMIINKTTT